MNKIVLFMLSIFSSSLLAASIEVDGAYIRLLPPTQNITAAFMVVKNTGDSDQSLVGVQSALSDRTELHTHIHENGMMRMRQVKEVVIPAHGEAQFKPGGYHIMLIDLKAPLELGQIADLTLSFDDGSSKIIPVEVKSVMAGMSTMKMEDTKMKQPAD